MNNLLEKTSSSDFWNDQNFAQATLKEISSLEKSVQNYKNLKKSIEESKELLNLCEIENDWTIIEDIMKTLKDLEEEIKSLEFKRMMAKENDHANAIIIIHPGAGGVESQDWAEMLLRMYLRYCSRKGFNTQIVDILKDDEAGIKSVTLTVEGEYSYGFLKAENGVHRLVRLSPFDAAHRRHTSFASVFVYPDIEEEIKIEIKEEDLKIETFRASGHGGQHVNVTDSAVRITHIPTSMSVSCQNERSQHKNKAMAMKILRARLYDLKMKEKQEEKKKVESQKMDINFGSQIRSYILHPYTLVKDHRTDFEVGNAEKILDGDLDDFIIAYLMKME